MLIFLLSLEVDIESLVSPEFIWKKMLDNCFIREMGIFRRAGVTLLEIVSEPDMRTGIEAAEYAAELQRLVRYLGVSNGNMQEGSLGCDVNISIRSIGQLEFVCRAIDF